MEPFRKLTTASNFGLLAAHRPAMRLLPEAEFAIGGDALPRLDAVWLNALVELGTLHLPRQRLKHAAKILDVRDYTRLITRCRRLGQNTRRINDSGQAAQGDTVSLHSDYYSSSATDLQLPYALDPWFYASGWHRRITSLSKNHRRLRLVFAGSVGEQYGDNTVFPIMNRWDVITCLLESFRSDILLVSNRAEIGEIEKTEKPIVVVLKQTKSGEKPTSHFFPREKYIKLLASADFALCPPGYTVPHSHNLIETLAVGAVPVLNYHRLCRPKLESGLTCLGFDTAAELQTVVKIALSMPAEQVAQLRKAVSGYYVTEMSPSEFGKRLKLAIQTGSVPVPVSVVNEYWSPIQYSRGASTWESE